MKLRQEFGNNYRWKFGIVKIRGKNLLRLGIASVLSMFIIGTYLISGAFQSHKNFGPLEIENNSVNSPSYTTLSLKDSVASVTKDKAVGTQDGKRDGLNSDDPYFQHIEREDVSKKNLSETFTIDDVTRKAQKVFASDSGTETLGYLPLNKDNKTSSQGEDVKQREKPHRSSVYSNPKSILTFGRHGFAPVKCNVSKRVSELFQMVRWLCFIKCLRWKPIEIILI